MDRMTLFGDGFGRGGEFGSVSARGGAGVLQEQQKRPVIMYLIIERMGLSTRAYHHALKLSRTIADLVENNAVRKVHLAEALKSRQHGPHILRRYEQLNISF